MKKITKYSTIPDSSVIMEDMVHIDYTDSFCIIINNKNNYSIDYITALVFSSSFPGWVKILLKLRAVIVKPFGLVTDIIPSLHDISPDIRYETGDRAVYFSVTDRSETEIVMGEDDKHLYFRTSLLTEKIKSSEEQLLYLNTIVQFHNLLGRIYFFFVKPFHKLIMKRTLIRFDAGLSRLNDNVNSV